MNVDDVTPKQAVHKPRIKGEPPKVVSREFSADDVDAVALAKFGRILYRFFACTENMFPDSDTTLYPKVHKFISSNEQDPYYTEALKRVGDKGVRLRRRLIAYVSLSFL